MNWRIWGGLALIAMLIGGPMWYTYGTDFERDIVITRTWTNVTGGGDAGVKQVYMIADAEGNSYKVADSMFYWQFRSTDLWNGLEEEERYRIRAYGWRVGFLSMYPNVIEIKE